MVLQTKSARGPNWEAFSAQRVNELRQMGQAVFVDFTAAWCLSCQVNERVALHNDEVVEKFDVKTAGINHDAKSLSGGNLQKFIVGREIEAGPKVLIVAQPTWGVDAAAAIDIHCALQELAAGGTAILVISQDLDELMTISTNFAVISEGRLSAPAPTGSQSIEEIGLLMGGVHTSAGTEATV